MYKIARSLAGLFIFSLIETATAGGIYILKESVTFTSNKNIFEPEAPVQITFRANDYVYGSNEYAYLSIAVVPVTEKVNVIKPPPTDRWLVYGSLMSRPKQSRDLANAASEYIFEFKAPKLVGKYKVIVNGVPLFRKKPFNTEGDLKRLFQPNKTDRSELVKFGSIYRAGFQTIADFSVSTTLIAEDETPPVYLRMDGEVPSSSSTPGGIRGKPLNFSWRVGNEFKRDKDKVLFRYQIAPDDNDLWGAWSSAREVNYFFLTKGVKQFKVQAKYSDGYIVLESAPASFQFTLEKDLIARPTKETLTKAPIGVIPVLQRQIAFNEVYANSRALLVGIWEFEDSGNFAQFDGTKIEADLSAMEAALRANGFGVSKLIKGRVKREEIAEALTKLINDSGENDRIFIYFSTHGFADPLLPADGYLATTDCRLREPSSRCLRLNDLETHAERALIGKKVRQLLFAVDSCFSGLGIVRKTAGVPDLTRIAVPQGAFMLTAGMANQVAQIDPNLKMSTFTHFLAEGLRGKADILGNNGVITLTELFLYVQYEVAKQTNSGQIPMLGRIKGDGEMLFEPRRQTAGAQ